MPERLLYSDIKASDRSSEAFLYEVNMADNELNLVRWKKLRAYVLRRDRFLDQVALRYGKRIDANVVHHIFPREHFPQYTYADWNLISVSQTTHNKLHDRDGHKLTEAGWQLLQRTARARGIDLGAGLKEILT